MKNVFVIIVAMALVGCGGSKVTEKESGEDSSVQPILVQGFRVQLFSTSQIDEVNAKKARAEAAFPEQWFYVVYEAPMYKLRGGNFVHRTEADSYAKYLTNKGFPDAWVVPEKILTNPQPRSLQQHQDKKQ